MFTGIITDIGKVARAEMRGDMRARISCITTWRASIWGPRSPATGLPDGDRQGPDWFDVDISAETISKTNITTQGWHDGRPLNLNAR